MTYGPHVYHMSGSFFVKVSIITQDWLGKQIHTRLRIAAGVSALLQGTGGDERAVQSVQGEFSGRQPLSCKSLIAKVKLL